MSAKGSSTRVLHFPALVDMVEAARLLHRPPATTWAELFLRPLFGTIAPADPRDWSQAIMHAHGAAANYAVSNLLIINRLPQIIKYRGKKSLVRYSIVS